MISFFVMISSSRVDLTPHLLIPMLSQRSCSAFGLIGGSIIPIYIQYFLWLKNALFLDFGRSYTSGPAGN